MYIIVFSVEKLMVKGSVQNLNYENYSMSGRVTESANSNRIATMRQIYLWDGKVCFSPENLESLI